MFMRSPESGTLANPSLKEIVGILVSTGGLPAGHETQRPLFRKQRAKSEPAQEITADPEADERRPNSRGRSRSPVRRKEDEPLRRRSLSPPRKPQAPEVPSLHTLSRS
jgi:hypothetical protein